MENEVDFKKITSKSAKTIKRVRFSDEIKRVDFNISDDSESFSYENDTLNISLTSAEVINDLAENSGNDQLDTVVSNHVLCFDPGLDANNNNELLACPPNVTVTYPPEVETPSTDESIQNKLSDSFEDSPTESITEHEDETPDLIDLINETQSMTLSSPTHAILEDKNFAELDSAGSWCKMVAENEDDDRNREIKENDIAPDIVQKQNNASRKRSLEGTFVEKQTVKINICLRKNDSAIKCADKLKSAVFNAWNEVKNKNPVHHATLYSTNANLEMAKSRKISDNSASNRAYDRWKKSKCKQQKRNHKISGHLSQKKSAEDLEAGKMAYKAWKRRKDEILKDQQCERLRKLEKERTDSLIKERIRKNNAQSAYSAWNAHKSFTLKAEKERCQWFLEREKEKLYLKIKKSDEAVKIYHDWLRKKILLESINNYEMEEDKPPWTPPGKSSNFN